MRTCKIDECDKSIWAYGFCSQHGQRYKKYGDPHKLVLEQHRMRNTPEYRSWVHMRDRCYNKNDKSYARYGGRGIEVCDRWKQSFTNFYDDMGSRPSADHSVDRIDNNGDYEPGNCRWATRSQQADNRRNGHRFEYNGKIMSIREMSIQYGINYDTLRQRLLRYGWPVDKALNN